MQKSLINQTAIVTGASSGIGKEVAKALAAAGASVVVNYRSQDDEAEAVADYIIQNGGKAITLKGDVSRENDVEELFNRTLDHFGRLDILINNAGFQKDAAFVDMTLDDWQAVIDVNLTGQFLCARAAARIFIKQGIDESISVAAGKIICMSSVHEIIPWAGHVNYAASKGGVLLLMKSIAQELAPQRIRVNGIAPGAIKTPINKDAWDTKESADKLLELIPYGRIGHPQDVGKLAVWLASDESDYITGASILIDGGMSLYPGFADNG